MRTIFLYFLCAITTFSCSDDPAESAGCHEGVVIGKIRSAGGGIAVSMSDATLSSHEWNGYNNVIEALNIPHDLTPGTKVYIFGRRATQEESQFVITADGAESNKPLIFALEYSTVGCSPQKE